MKFEQQLSSIRHKIQKELLTGDCHLDSSLNFVTHNMGKMVRPTFVLIGSTFGTIQTEENKESVTSIAAAIESLHMATLLHDDIIDEAKLRRGQPSVQAKYSKEYALYMGDFILIRSFMMLTNLEIPRDVAAGLAKVVNQICIGEMKQHKYRYKTDVFPLKYLHVISRKTAALFAVSLSVGAKYSEADESVAKKLGRIGYEIGMAFQLVDDLLDYSGEVATVGKDLESDLIQGYYNIPVLFALQSKQPASTRLKELLEQPITRENNLEVIELVKQLGGIEKTQELAKRYSGRAMKLIQQLPEGDGKKALLELTPTLLNRIK